MNPHVNLIPTAQRQHRVWRLDNMGKNEDIGPMKKAVILFGGSFNPPHPAHFEKAEQLLSFYRPCEVWMMFSQNPFKSENEYVSLDDRMKMGKIIAKHFSPEIKLNDESEEISLQIGRKETYYILKELKKRYPENHFVWAMGADSFAGFHEWEERDLILKEFPVIVVGRLGYTEDALCSPTARECSALRFSSVERDDLIKNEKGWTYLELPEVDQSSTALRKAFASGQLEFNDSRLNELAQYVYNRGLYGAGPAHA